MSAKPLVVVGSANADRYVELERLPLPGETIGGRGMAILSGGKGANQAAAAAKLGAETWFVGQVGSDADATLLRSDLIDAGVKLDHLAIADAPTGSALILLQKNGENSIVVIAGANHAWNRVPATASKRIAGAGMVLLQCEIPEAVNRDAIAIARRSGVPVVLDLGGSGMQWANDVLPNIALLSPNEIELAHLSGMPASSRDEAIAAARRLIDRGVAAVLVKRGARGALLVRRDADPIAQDAFKVTPIDTTGAGDCFTAAYAVAMLAGRPEPERLRFACAAGALCVQRKGAMLSMPTASEVAASLEKRSS